MTGFIYRFAAKKETGCERKMTKAKDEDKEEATKETKEKSLTKKKLKKKT